MSTHNICFREEIRNIMWILSLTNLHGSALFGGILRYLFVATGPFKCNRTIKCCNLSKNICIASK